MSTPIPGYVLSRQLPPTSPARSTIAKSVIPARFSRTPAAMPPGPAPMTTTSWSTLTVHCGVLVVVEREMPVAPPHFQVGAGPDRGCLAAVVDVVGVGDL